MNEANSFPYELTIGMIVKNEAVGLRRCLEGLTPLRQAIPCELIITDTGSTDGTQNIAKEFADVYLEFHWCDDFSKARNTTTAMAKGRWYIYLDADHTFDESMLALADFLTSPESDTPIEAATLSIRNYQNPQGTQYLDSTSCLLHNFSKGPKEFVYPIHECIQFYGEAPLLPVLIHHWGYLVEGEKQNRNQPILEKAIANDPYNFHHHHHLIRDTLDLTLRKNFLDRALSCGNQDTIDPFYWTVCLSACQWAWESRDACSFQEGKQRLLPIQENTFLHLELLGMELSLTMELEREKGLVDLFLEYRQVFHYLENRSNLPFRSSFRYQFTQARHGYLLEAKVFRYLLQKDQHKEGLRLLEGSTMLSQRRDNGSHPYLGDYSDFALWVGGYSLLRRWHETLVHQGCEGENNSFLMYLEQKFQELPPKEKQDFLTAFSTHPTTSYTALWALRHSGYHYEKSPSLALSFLEHTPDLYTNPLYRDVFYSAFRCGEDKFLFLERATLSHLRTLHKEILSLDPQYYKLVLSSSFGTSSCLSVQRGMGYLILDALMHASALPQQTIVLLPYVKSAVALLAGYVTAVYQPLVLEETFAEHTPSLLPPPEQCALFLLQSFASPQEKERWYRRCVEVYPCSEALIGVALP